MFFKYQAIYQPNYINIYIYIYVAVSMDESDCEPNIDHHKTAAYRNYQTYQDNVIINIVWAALVSSYYRFVAIFPRIQRELLKTTTSLSWFDRHLSKNENMSLLFLPQWRTYARLWMGGPLLYAMLYQYTVLIVNKEQMLSVKT